MVRMGKKRRASEADDIDDSVVKKNKSVAPAIGGADKDDEGNPFWELSNKRRVSVSRFKNACFINIREYYDKDGKSLPGKKGIALSVDQYIALLKAAPSITAALREQGQEFENPQCGQVPEVPSKKNKIEKSNIEATSDEDEGEDED